MQRHLGGLRERAHEQQDEPGDEVAVVAAEGLVGLEYKDDCWVFRVVAQRTPTATNVATTSLFFQLELTGLSSLGSNPLTALRNSVPGYTRVNEPAP